MEWTNASHALRILVVEDEEVTVDLLREGLMDEGFEVDVAHDGKEGLEQASSASYDVMIVDLMLPKVDGLQLIRRMRTAGNETPVIILSARSGVNDKVTGLETGADDYLAKPFALSELLARLRSLLRRGRLHGATVELTVGDLRMNLLSRRVYRADQDIELQSREFLLLEYLMRNSGQVVNRAQILKNVWGYDFHPSTNLVEVHICRLREKIERPGEPRLLRTIRGEGYILSEPGPAESSKALNLERGHISPQPLTPA